MAANAPKAPLTLTEDEAALYDRQLRLWGVEAQQRLRNATVLVVNLKGLATETIKNIVLAGIGKLIVLDGSTVSAEDLGAGFFFTDDDVGKNRATAAKSRIENLNPLVSVEVITSYSQMEGEGLDDLVKLVDLVCVTDTGRSVLDRVNDTCTRLGKKFYCGSTFGMLGYIFCDLGRHEYFAKDKKNQSKTIKLSLTYPPMSDALGHHWTGLTKFQTKELKPAAVFTVLAVLEWQFLHGGQLPDDPATANELESLANSMIKERGVNPAVIQTVPREQMETVATTAAHEFAPVCAIVGGFLAQDILKTLQAKDAPIANFFTFDGFLGGATTCRWGVQ